MIRMLPLYPRFSLWFVALWLAASAAVLLLLNVWAIGSASASDAVQYRLAAGDVISIRVFGEPDLSVEEVRLDDGGSFSYPFLGQVQARGLTSGQLEQRLHDGLVGDYLVSPRVTVSVLTYRDFFVNGEVRRPGGYAWRPGLTLRQAVSMAGGFTERASQRRMTIIPDGQTDDQARNADLDTPINPGDIITIRQGLF
jgi:protein involved in polysaccharide export with SLBB domain